MSGLNGSYWSVSDSRKRKRSTGAAITDSVSPKKAKKANKAKKASQQSSKPGNDDDANETNSNYDACNNGIKTGDFFEQYELVDKQIGKGSSSVVKLCKAKSNNNSLIPTSNEEDEAQELYAVKIVDKSLFDNKEDLNRISEEFKIVHKLKHQSVVQMYQLFDSPKYLYVVMEYVAGGDLLTKVEDSEEERLEEDVAKDIISQLLHAVAYLHSKHTCHRDLKPENILIVEGTNTIKICDFGIAKVLQREPPTSLSHNNNKNNNNKNNNNNNNNNNNSNEWKKVTHTKSFVGTKSYLAPEVILSKQGKCDGYGQEVDIWACGIIMYTILSGLFPFYTTKEDKSTGKAIPLEEQITTANFNFNAKVWQGITANAKSLIDRLLQVEPSKRATPAQALQSDWFDR